MSVKVKVENKIEAETVEAIDDAVEHCIHRHFASRPVGAGLAPALTMGSE